MDTAQTGAQDDGGGMPRFSQEVGALTKGQSPRGSSKGAAVTLAWPRGPAAAAFSVLQHQPPLTPCPVLWGPTPHQLVLVGEPSGAQLRLVTASLGTLCQEVPPPTWTPNGAGRPLTVLTLPRQNELPVTSTSRSACPGSELLLDGQGQGQPSPLTPCAPGQAQLPHPHTGPPPSLALVTLSALPAALLWG